ELRIRKSTVSAQQLERASYESLTASAKLTSAFLPLVQWLLADASGSYVEVTTPALGLVGPPGAGKSTLLDTLETWLFSQTDWPTYLGQVGKARAVLPLRIDARRAYGSLVERGGDADLPGELLLQHGLSDLLAADEDPRAVWHALLDE